MPVGRIGRPHGVKGEVTLVSLSDDPGRFEPGAEFVTNEERHLVVRSVRRHHGSLLAVFEGCNDRTEAEKLRGAILTIAGEERRPLEADEYWPDELEGLVAVGQDGTRIGLVTGVVLGEAQDRLVITVDAGGTFELPFVEELVGEVHPSGGFVVILPPEGLY